MALVALPNVGSQLDRAICAYLISVGAPLFTWENVLPSDSLEIKTYPNATIQSHRSEHDPVPTGNEYYEVSITCKYSVALPPNTANPYAARVARDQFVGAIMAAMLISDDGTTLDYVARAISAAGNALATTGTAQEQQNNSDMANFTALHCYYLGAQRGEPDQDGCAWVEVRRFRIAACPSLIDMANEV